MLAPVVFQERPQDLIEILVAPSHGAAEDPFLNGAELAQRAVSAAVLKKDPRLEAVGADRSEPKRQSCARLRETPVPRTDGASVASHSSRLEGRLELPDLRDADNGPRRIQDDHVHARQGPRCDRESHDR